MSSNIKVDSTLKAITVASFKLNGISDIDFSEMTVTSETATHKVRLSTIFADEMRERERAGVGINGSRVSFCK